MENNKGYLSRLGPVTGIIILVTTALVFIYPLLFNESGDRSQWLLFFFNLVPAIIFYIALGMLTFEWKAAYTAIAVLITISLIKKFVLQPMMENQENWRLLAMDYSELLVPISFFLAARAGKKMGWIILALLCMHVMESFYNTSAALEPLARLLGIRIEIPQRLTIFVTFFAQNIVQLVLICELLNFARGKNIGFNQRLLNPGNEYEKLPATIVFFTFKLTIVILVLSGFATIFQMIEYGSYLYGGAGYLKFYYFSSLLLTVPLLFFIGWYLRKFILEFYFSYNFSSRTGFWFLLVPVLGFIGWLVMIADSEKQTTFQQREATLGEFTSARRDGLMAIFVILLALRFLFVLISGQASAIISVMLSAALLAFMFSSLAGYYFNLGLNLCVAAVIWILIITGSRTEYIVLWPLLLLNAVEMYMLLPALHFESFSYLQPEEEPEWQPGQDLF